MDRARSHLLLASLIIIGATASAGAATVVTLQGDNGHGEICRFRAGAAEDPFRRWFEAQDVTCAAGGSAITFPAGLWNVFARTNETVTIDPVLVDGAKPPDALTLALTPAATLSIQLPPGDTGVVYAPKHLIAFPSSDRLAVPAGEELWLFVLTKNTPAAVVVIPPTSAGTQRTVDARNPAGPPSLVGWLQVPEADRIALKAAHGMASPHISIAAGGKEADAGLLPPVESMNGALVLIDGVKPGDGDLQLSGRHWLPFRRRVTVGAQPLTIVHQPIAARAAATVVVEWSALSDLPALDRSLGSCEPPEPPRFELTISSCAEPKPGQRADPSACTPIRKEPLQPEAKFGSLTVGDVAPGIYRAELRYGKLPPIGSMTSVAPLRQEPMRIQALYVEAYGSLTRGGERLGEDARLDFPGAGIGFAPRDTGEYHAVLLGPIGDEAKIDIVTCSGEHAFVFTDKPMLRNARLDIDIPDNLLTVTVVDTFTHARIETASLRFTVMSANKFRGPIFTKTFAPSDDSSREPRADREKGQFVIKAVPTRREIRLQVTNPGYKKQDVEPFSMQKTDKKEIEVELVPLNGSQGKIISSHPFEKAMIYWFAGGAETERADLEPDGTFTFEQVHLRDETMTVVSASHPLWITRPPVAERRKTLEIRFPDSARVRNPEVFMPMPPRLMTVVGVAIGGMRVPMPALVQHLALRAAQPIVRGAGPLVIPALAETGPIDIIRGGSMQIVGAISPEALILRDPLAVAMRRLDQTSDVVAFDGK